MTLQVHSPPTSSSSPSVQAFQNGEHSSPLHLILIQLHLTISPSRTVLLGRWAVGPWRSKHKNRHQTLDGAVGPRHTWKTSYNFYFHLCCSIFFESPLLLIYILLKMRRTWSTKKPMKSNKNLRYSLFSNVMPLFYISIYIFTNSWCLCLNLKKNPFILALCPRCLQRKLPEN